ncbi:MAG: bacterioferritin [Bryobacterales bacterium]|nr:bacterioferritin [Bryobacteraceae bacterium]MDW8129524.1 bacterioferritin [Bryobacterales bacterium]
MKGNETVIARLNEALHDELTAIHQYMLDAEMCENWGFSRLASLIKKQAIGEMKHAERLLERILFLEGTPEMGGNFQVKPAASVPDLLRQQLEMERGAVAAYNASARICQEAGDNGSKELFDSLLEDEEGHTDFLETQLGLIEQTGLANYLSQQMHS